MTVRLDATQRGFRALVAAGADPSALAPARRRRLLAGVRGLAKPDADALARIPTDRALVYHDLVVGGHHSMVRFACGGTLTLLKLATARRGARGGASSVALVEEFLAAPGGPKTHSLRELADRFGRFLRRRFARVFRAHPLLGEILAFERAEIDVDLEVDGPGTPADETALKKLARGTVGALLDTRVLRPTYSRLLRTRFDVPHALRVLRGEDDVCCVDEVVRPGPSRTLLTREPEWREPVWREITADLDRDFRAFDAGRPFRMEAWAERRARRGPRGESDEAALSRVTTEVVSLLRDGALLLA